MTRFAIAPARSADDLAAFARLLREYADGLGIDLSFQGFEAELATLPGNYAPPAGALLLARSSDGASLGSIGMRPLPQLGRCEMKRLYLVPAARGLGLGKALVEAILAAAAQAGHREMVLDTAPWMTAALSLYEKAGFLRIPAYYDTPVAGTVFMRRDL